MKKISKITLIAFLVIVFACVLTIWIYNSPAVDDYRWIRNRETERELVAAFVTALRINHPAAYEMIDPSLSPRLDEWMNTHQAKKCARKAYIFLSGNATRANGQKLGWDVVFGCVAENYTHLTFKVDRIFIKDMKVIEWGEVIEEED
ncbi:MAG: hypothetical protein DCC56_04560 [Anaerolineae bacterium]|nr:MAG: hypothetical protein DCC56_04560 [Anaerolineae bacterium]WKZ43878.1 MAG: hypothetical protein QY302_17415 [Anaerolineales bacterium]